MQKERQDTVENPNFPSKKPELVAVPLIQEEQQARERIFHIVQSEGVSEQPTLSPAVVSQVISEFEKRYASEKDCSLLPFGVTVDDLLTEDQDATNRLEFRCNLIADLMRVYENTPHAQHEIDPHTLTRLQVLNRINASLEMSEENNPLQKLYPHQFAAFQDLSDFFEGGGTSGWIKKPTGAGKTVVFCALAGIAKVKTLILVPKVNLIGQTINAIQQFSGTNIRVTSYYGKNKDISGDVVVCTYQSLQKLIEEGIEFSIVIGDEFHRSLSRQRRDRLEEIPGKIFQVGFSATPKFSEEKNLDNLGNCIHELTLNDAIRDGVVAGARVVLALTRTNIAGIDTSAGDYNLAHLGRVVNSPQRNQAIINLLKNKIIGDSTTVISCVDKNHCETLARMAQNSGLKADFVHSGIDEFRNERRRDMLSNGQIQFLFFVDQLTEGWDCPRAEILVNARPTKSVVVAEQRGGRVLRNHMFHDGRKKLYGIIIEIVDQGDRPVLMSDILGGTYALPDTVEREFRKRVGDRAGEDEDIPDLEIVLELEEIARTLSNIADSLGLEHSPNTLEMTSDLAKDIIQSAHLGKRELFFSTAFFHHQFSHPLFSGYGRQLVKLYFRDHKHLELSRVNSPHFSVMMQELDLAVERERFVEHYTAEQLREEIMSNGIDPRRHMMKFNVSDALIGKMSPLQLQNHLEKGDIVIKDFHQENEIKNTLVSCGYDKRYAFAASMIAHAFGTDLHTITEQMPQTCMLVSSHLYNGFNLPSYHRRDDPAVPTGFPMTKNAQSSVVKIPTYSEHAAATTIDLTREQFVRAYFPKGEITTPEKLIARLKLHSGTTTDVNNFINDMQWAALEQYFASQSKEQRNEFLIRLLIEQTPKNIWQSFERFLKHKIDLKPLLPVFYALFDDARMAWTEKVILTGEKILILLAIDNTAYHALIASDAFQQQHGEKYGNHLSNISQSAETRVSQKIDSGELLAGEVRDPLPAGSKIIYKVKNSQKEYEELVLKQKGPFAAKNLSVFGLDMPLTLPDQFFAENEGFLEIPANDPSDQPTHLTLDRWWNLLNKFF